MVFFLKKNWVGVELGLVFNIFSNWGWVGVVVLEKNWVGVGYRVFCDRKIGLWLVLWCFS